MERTGDSYRVVLAGERRPRGDVPGEQSALAQDPHVARQRPWQGAARCLHVPEAGPRARLRERPCDAGQLRVQRHDSDGAVQGQVEVAGPLLQRIDRVLERRVVELHHVSAPRAVR